MPLQSIINYWPHLLLLLSFFYLFFRIHQYDLGNGQGAYKRDGCLNRPFNLACCVTMQNQTKVTPLFSHHSKKLFLLLPPGQKKDNRKHQCSHEKGQSHRVQRHSSSRMLPGPEQGQTPIAPVQTSPAVVRERRQSSGSGQGVTLETNHSPGYILTTLPLWR